MTVALTAMIKLEDKVTRQNEAIKAQQAKIENLTERIIRREAQLEFLAGAALIWLADRIGVRHILTTDRNDFGIYRLQGSKRFDVVKWFD